MDVTESVFQALVRSHASPPSALLERSHDSVVPPIGKGEIESVCSPSDGEQHRETSSRGES